MPKQLEFWGEEGEKEAGHATVNDATREIHHGNGYVDQKRVGVHIPETSIPNL